MKELEDITLDKAYDILEQLKKDISNLKNNLSNREIINVMVYRAENMTVDFGLAGLLDIRLISDRLKDVLELWSNNQKEISLDELEFALKYIGLFQSILKKTRKGDSIPKDLVNEIKEYTWQMTHIGK